MRCPFLCSNTIVSHIVLEVGGGIIYMIDYDLIYDTFIQIIHKLLEQQQEETHDEDDIIR